MKAIKIASGVAVSALALAISAQASAAAHEGSATETEWSFTGSMEFLTVIDMAATAKDSDGNDVDTVIDVELDEEDDFDEGKAGDAWGLEAELSVVHGPFSGVLGMRNNDGTASVYADDIVITDGAISFGQVGSLVDETHEYAYDMDDSGDSAAARSEGRDVGAALRYTMDGLKVQVEGANRIDTANDGEVNTSATDSDYGVAAQYAGEADALSYVAEAQFRTSSLGGDDDSPYVYVGAGATYTMDIVTAKFGLNQYSVTTAANPGAHDDSILEYGFELTATPIDALSVYLKGQDLDAGSTNTDDSMALLLGAAYTVDALKFTGEYKFTDADNGDEVMGRVDYTAGAIGAYGEITLANIDADTANAPYFEAGVSYTQDNGVKYAADYDLRAEGDEVGGTPVNSEVNRFRLTAAYAF